MELENVTLKGKGRLLRAEHPRDLMMLLQTKEEFIEWLNMGTIEDLGYVLKAFEREEMFEECTTIKEIMVEMQENDNL